MKHDTNYIAPSDGYISVGVTANSELSISLNGFVIIAGKAPSDKFLRMSTYVRKGMRIRVANFDGQFYPLHS